MAYSDFLEEINKNVQATFSQIYAQHNFDNGPEFEIALCKILRLLLPNKYGICRGFIVSKDGQSAGDDIIIYDQERFPTLRLLEDKTYAHKQNIPVESVYAYIEAKHTLCLEGNNGQSLKKSLQQINAVKQIPRQKVPISQITPALNITNLAEKLTHPYWPNYKNPLYTAIISRYVRIKKDKPICTSQEFWPIFHAKCAEITSNLQAPDLIIAGSDIVAIPSIGTQIESPFFIPGISKLDPLPTVNKAYSAGLISMLYAFEYIMLGKIHWPSVLAHGLNLNLNMGNSNPEEKTS